MSDESDSPYTRDQWPNHLDGTEFDGTGVMALLSAGKSPFVWDVGLLIKETEEVLNTKVIDIPRVSKGANAYGFLFKLSNRPDVLARLARNDVNVPGFAGWPFEKQVRESELEASVYRLLQYVAEIPVSPLLYHRLPVHRPACQDILGRRLFLFEVKKGQDNVWKVLNDDQTFGLVDQAAAIRGALFNYNPPQEFIQKWLLDSMFEMRPKLFPLPIAPTREFVVGFFTSKIEATIRDLGDKMGWGDDDDDEYTVGPATFAAKQALLRLIPHILPPDTEPPSLYRFVLEHGDYGIHNMTITVPTSDDEIPKVTSLFDWETGCVVPAILSDPLMAVGVDFIAGPDAEPVVIGWSEEDLADDKARVDRYANFSRQYFRQLYAQAPDYERVIQAGKDARHIWFAFRDWRDDPEEHFGPLGVWVQKRLVELGVEK
ncbi:hypothetical protein FB45DRAFT_942065 [Roridomyces roridus]|uniref:Aminoglycoside phosphotransferase domain-containing protein n=1 Tax=Roridomyces roridus TaxID=1738132 RepID=A0AAD7B5V8_9AGAR|nr:hypothetical protein FB45DRAFT_942065 [Roridomyces roridus]